MSDESCFAGRRVHNVMLIYRTALRKYFDTWLCTIYIFHSSPTHQVITHHLNIAACQRHRFQTSQSPWKWAANNQHQFEFVNLFSQVQSAANACSRDYEVTLRLYTLSSLWDFKTSPISHSNRVFSCRRLLEFWGRAPHNIIYMRSAYKNKSLSVCDSEYTQWLLAGTEVSRTTWALCHLFCSLVNKRSEKVWQRWSPATRILSNLTVFIIYLVWVVWILR